MSAYVSILAKVSVVTFLLEGAAILFLPNVFDGLESLLEQTGDHESVVSQGAALLLIAASIYLSDVLFGGLRASLDSPTAVAEPQSDGSRGSAARTDSRLFAEFPTGNRARLVIESASGEQLKLVMETELPKSATERRHNDGQIHGFTLSEFSKLAVAALGFLGSLYVLVGENAVLVAVVLVPPVYALIMSSLVVGTYRIIRGMA